MEFDDEAWAAFFTLAKAQQPGAPLAPVHGIVGRSLAKASDITCRLWAKYRSKLLPYLAQIAIAALDALLAAQPSIDTINPPGPQ